MKSGKWTKEETDWLMINYQKLSNIELEAHLHRKYGAIKAKARLIGANGLRIKGFKDLHNTWFGFIEVLKDSGKSDEKGRILWECHCHACDKPFIVNGHQLRPGRSKSCGCVRRHKGADNVMWRGIGTMPATMFTRVKAGAKRRKLEFNLTFQYMWDLYEKQNGKCRFSGMDIGFGRVNLKEITASLDRINSELGYLKGNVQWIHKDINYMKQTMKDEYFIDLCKKIAKYNE